MNSARLAEFTVFGAAALRQILADGSLILDYDLKRSSKHTNPPSSRFPDMAPQSSDTQAEVSMMEMPKQNPLPSNANSSTQPDQASSDSDGAKDQGGDQSKRFIPDHKKPDAALTFPEKVRE